MAACPELVFAGVTAAVWREIRAEVAAEIPGVVITADSGEETGQDITVKWRYDPAGGVLTLQCTDSPFLDPCEVINARIADLIEPIIKRGGKP